MKKRKLRKEVKYLLIFVLCIAVLITLVVRNLSTKKGQDTNNNTVNVTTMEGSEEFEKVGMSKEDIAKITSLPNYRPELASRYASWKANSLEECVMQVNCDMDLEPYSVTNIIDDDRNMALLVNKFNALKEGYVPNDLVPVREYYCVQGEDYSCQTVDQIELRSEVYEAYLNFCNAAREHEINIRAIAGYRSYDYQKNLWDYYASVNGQEYADEYYARPGQSEHNSGLAVDITFNGYNYSEIENYDGYQWIYDNMHNYGFILRYPEDKVDVTRYGYESWHLRYVGKDVATTIYNNNWTLEEYYGSQK